jgi:hypothetical protein
MTRIEFFSFTDEQWNDIKTVVHEALGLDADVIMICEKVGSVVTPLRDCIEIKASTHTFCSVISRVSSTMKNWTRKTANEGLNNDS